MSKRSKTSPLLTTSLKSSVRRRHEVLHRKKRQETPGAGLHLHEAAPVSVGDDVTEIQGCGRELLGLPCPVEVHREGPRRVLNDVAHVEAVKEIPGASDRRAREEPRAVFQSGPAPVRR